MRLNKIVVLSTLMATASLQAFAVPAVPGKIKYPTANGDTINVYLRGDEHSHFFTSTDGYMLLRGDDQQFRYAIAEGNQLKASQMLAADPGKRSIDAEALLSSIDKEQPFKVKAGNSLNVSRKGVNRVAPEADESTFPTIGSPHVCIILVEFADNSFASADASTAFNDMFNKPGYNANGASGSVADFFKASSNGQFTPTLDVLGPVKLSKNMSYYGGNDWSGNDKAPEEMVIDACTLLDPTVDFSVYDTDNDGVIDNVYVVYAGYGEAQGAPANTIWPHSWAVYNGAGRTKYLDGKLLDHYATSNELRGTSGKVMDGIGTFCHEFSHVMGLPDLYATTYTSAFTPGKYSLMDYGSYNNDSNTPPTHSGYERYCLGWIEPKVLDAPETISLKSIADEGHYNDVCIIKTPKTNEYFILENRQKKSWDSYIPGHGMLIWHIDYNPSVWASNTCNNTVGRQYIDIEEADNIQSESTRAGDTFPGTNNVTSFTDDTKPSMLTWSNTRLESPITNIQENDGTISFLFKGGVDIFDPVVAIDPADSNDTDDAITPGSFIAKWNKVDLATGYLLSVYTKPTTSQSVRNGAPASDVNYLPGYNKKEVGDVDQAFVTGLTPATTYYFVVQATDGLHVSAASDEIAVTTLDPTLEYKQAVALDATEIGSSGFTANWATLDDADGYKITLYSLQLGDPYITTADFANGTLPAGWTSYGTSSETSNSGYAVQLPSRRFKINNSYIRTAEFADGIRSFSFWYRASADNTSNSINIEGLVNGEWVALETVSPITALEGGATYTLDNVPAGCTQINLTFRRKEGDVAIDDIKIGHGGPMTLLPIEGETDCDAGNVTYYAYTGLQPDKNYGYSVKAYNATMVSLPSNVVSVVTKSNPSGLGNATEDAVTADVTTDGNYIVVRADAGTQISVYEIAGRTVETSVSGTSIWRSRALTPGVYIVSLNGRDHVKVYID